jgi:hypothetical protein
MTWEGSMNVTAIASGIASWLAAPAATAGAGEAGKSLWLCLKSTVLSKFAGDHNATAVIEHLLDEPTSTNQAAVAALLETRFGRDESFAHELGSLLDAAQSLPELSQVLVNLSGNASISKQANVVANLGDINL